MGEIKIKAKLAPSWAGAGAWAELGKNFLTTNIQQTENRLTIFILMMDDMHTVAYLFLMNT